VVFERKPNDPNAKLQENAKDKKIEQLEAQLQPEKMLWPRSCWNSSN